jgi:hypothetical protein
MLCLGKILTKRTKVLLKELKAFKVMGVGPPLDLTVNSSKPLTGAILRKEIVLNE